MSPSVAIFDLDRTVLKASSAPVIQRHLKEAGLTSRDFPAEGLFQTAYELFGESRIVMNAARSQSGCKPGWGVDEIAAVAEKIADELVGAVQPFVAPLIADHKAAGRTVLLATGSNLATIEAFAKRLGFDDVIATKWEISNGVYTGNLDGERLLGAGKLAAVKAWVATNQIDLTDSYMYSDSRYDADLLSLVGNPVAVNPDAGLAVLARLRGWTVRHLDKPQGVAKFAGREVQAWLRPFSAPSLDPLATIEISGLENIPSTGGVILVFNHRSYYDSTAMAYVISKSGRDGRFLGKKEVFDVPLFGTIAKAMGGIRVDRGTGSDEPLDKAIEALRGGDMIMMAPQGTIPRGLEFFNPVLKGRWGAAKLAKATGAVVVPVGLWGTEKVWPRSSQIPKITLPGQTKPVVTVTVGKPFKVTSADPDTGTKQIMKKITALLPLAARKAYTPTEEELAATYPSNYKGDLATAEAERRPGID